MTSAAAHTAGTRLRRRVPRFQRQRLQTSPRQNQRPPNGAASHADFAMSAMSKTVPITRRQRGVGDVTNGGLSDNFKRRSDCPAPAYSVQSAAWYNGGKVQSALVSANV